MDLQLLHGLRQAQLRSNEERLHKEDQPEEQEQGHTQQNQTQARPALTTGIPEDKQGIVMLQHKG